MKQERYAKILGEFELLISLGKQVSNSLVGVVPKERYLSYADSIYTKLLCHSLSLHKLSPQIESSSNQELWDFPSACAIARCIIEAHDVLGYMVFSKVSSEERDFRLVLWHLHDQQRRSKMLVAINSHNPEAEKIHNQAKELLQETINHTYYQNLPKHIQNKIKSGDAPFLVLSQRELNAANLVNHEYHTSTTMWLSQYVHTFPMSMHQLNDFRAGTAEAFHMSAMPIQYSLGFIARVIKKMVETFPEGSIELTDSETEILSMWSDMVEHGVTSA